MPAKTSQAINLILRDRQPAAAAARGVFCRKTISQQRRRRSQLEAMRLKFQTAGKFRHSQLPFLTLFEYLKFFFFFQIASKRNPHDSMLVISNYINL